ncbi:hypothetical protein [Sulfidibacter corallicola]|uniref:DUF378 domain-containing protein n=1 Tax=Sulfidibacter corallicola TaxID=2818388 RepID=A0A8A4TTE1_SULCO|nr:hypothetical protein [Sulfidibacter corallicola]QTD52331.1 hypothetical protein J3U87_07635 [Sulfidibacter corallicola]
MREIGKTLMFFGVGSVILYFLQMEFIILAWIDAWGEGIGWLIRSGLIVLGAVLFFLGGGFQSGYEEA